MTRMLVRRHRARIERVAKALLDKTTLTAKQIDKLVGLRIGRAGQRQIGRRR
jgi:hypothetical protein